MGLIGIIRKIFGFPDWDGYYQEMGDWYNRELEFGMTTEKEKFFSDCDDKISKAFNKRRDYR